MTREKWAKMTKDEKNILVAELAGWERGPKKEIKLGMFGVVVPMSCWHDKNEKESWQDNPPSFCSDLNAMYDAEEKYIMGNKNIRNRYEDELLEAVGGPGCRLMPDEIDHWHATADQRALAFVMTME